MCYCYFVSNTQIVNLEIIICFYRGGLAELKCVVLALLMLSVG